MQTHTTTHSGADYPFVNLTSTSWSKSRKILLVLFLALLLLFVAFCSWLFWLVRDISFSDIGLQTSHPIITIAAADSSPLSWDGNVRGSPISRENLPQNLVDAFVSVEDRSFFSHPGVDPFGIARAMLANYREGRIVEGASTITQQYVRSRFLTRDRTYDRKIREVMLSVWLEHKADKNAILAGYLNSVYFGDGIYGASAAAERFFGKPVAKLSVAEAALIAGLVKAPTSLNPRNHPQAAKNRARVVIGAMEDNDKLSAPQASVAREELRNMTFDLGDRGSWFGDWAHEQAIAVSQRLVRSDISHVGVKTTLDPSLQALAEDTVRDFLDRDGERMGASEAALVAMRPDGSVVAMVGGRDYHKSRFNRATQARRQPGSLFKLFVYYAALRNGWSLNDVVEDTPLRVGKWEPRNYDGRFRGATTIVRSFAQSRNIPAVRLAMDVGIEQVISAARDLGVEGDMTPTPSLALGASEVSLLDITGAFASVRAGKLGLEPWGISGIEVEGIDQVLRLRNAVPREMPRENQREMIALLRQVVEHGTGRAAMLDNGIAAGKTGTSEDYRDAWFVGFSDKLVVGVWVGNDDNSPMKRVTGGQLPARIWKRFVENGTPMLDPSKGDGVEMAESGTALTCNVSACGEAYRSFRASDCSYQPYVGPRAACTIPADGNTVLSASVWADTDLQNVEQGGNRDLETMAGAGLCDVDACSQRYASFRPSDCTYQPYSGGRRLCPYSSRETVMASSNSLLTSYNEEPVSERRYRQATPFFRVMPFRAFNRDRRGAPNIEGGR